MADSTPSGGAATALLPGATDRDTGNVDLAIGGMHRVFPALGVVTRAGEAHAFETQA